MLLCKADAALKQMSFEMDNHTRAFKSEDAMRYLVSNYKKTSKNDTKMLLSESLMGATLPVGHISRTALEQNQRALSGILSQQILQR